MLGRHARAPSRQNEVVAYFVALASAFLVVSAATALRPGRRGLLATLAYPVGWAAGELPGQGIFLELALLGVLWWWGWPKTHWLSVVVLVVASVVVVENLALIGILFYSRRIVRHAMSRAPDRPLLIARPRDDLFGSWWRTALLIPFHPRDMQLHHNLVYGPLERHRLDVWRLSTTPANAPVIYYLHGGAWTFGDKREQGRPMLHEFVRRGWVVVASNYRLAPRHPWPAQIEDATRALGWIKANIATYGASPDRVVIAGGSAGGHLAALLALSANDPTWRPPEMAERTDWRVRGAISFYGVLEMTGDDAHWRGLGRGIRTLLERRVVQVPFLGHEALYRSLSPYERISADAPPFFVVQGVNDTLVEVNVARDFVAKYRAHAFAPIYYVELPFTQHAFDVTASPRTSATTRAAVAFAESVVAPRPALSAALVQSYQVPPAALFVRVGEEWLEAASAASRLGPLFVVTSDNPYSQVQEAEVNQARRDELRRTLQRLGVDFSESVARDPQGRWRDEVGAALLESSREHARALARAWDQFAYYEVTPEGVSVRDAESDAVLV
jgi:acetyl esterase/lipase